MLIVFFSVTSSPRASTVILRPRSPFATAVVTSAMSRTWLVRFFAIWLTLSVSSFQMPDTSFTSAVTPSVPSVPTRRATRVTSAENRPSLSTVLLIVFLSARISPRASTSIFLLRSPPAIAVMTSAIERTCDVRFDAMPLTFCVSSRHTPETSATSA